MTRPIVVGYIPTPEGEAALERGIKEANAHQSRLLAVNIIHDDGSTIDERYVPENVTAKIRTRLENSGAEFEIVKTNAQDVAEALLEVADKNDAETIVLGLRKRSRVSKLILGSIAQRILMDAETSVLVVRAS